MKERTKLIIGGILKPILLGLVSIVLLIVLFVTPFILPLHYQFQQPAEEITEILIVDLVGSDAWEHPDAEEISIYLRLEQDAFSPFLRAFRRLTYRSTGKEPSFRSGPAVRIGYADGSVELISPDCSCYHSQGECEHFARAFDYEAFITLLETYGYIPHT